MKNRKIITGFLIFFLLYSTGDAFGQRWRLQRYEISGSLGTTFSFMDLGSGDPGALESFQINSSRFSLGTHMGYRLTEEILFKLDLNYLILGATDVNRTPERFNHFISHGFEHSLRLDVDILNLGTSSTSSVYSKRGMVNNFGKPRLYLFSGFGALLSKAKVMNSNNEEITSGFYDNSFQYSPVLSAGMLLTFELTSYLDIGVEAGGRLGLWKNKGWSDLMDGYNNNTEANKYSDRYIVFNFKAIYSIRTNRNGLPDFGSIGR